VPLALAVTCLAFAMIATGCHATHASQSGGSSSPSPDAAAALAVARELYDAWVSGKLDTARSLASPNAFTKLSREPPRESNPPTSCYVVSHDGDLACGSAAPGYSFEFFMTRSVDGSYRVSDVVPQYCDPPTGARQIIICELHPIMIA
jgi:hypothetical protein